MASSQEWRLYYEQNARSLLDIPWQFGGDLAGDEKRAVSRSVQEFQAGESSEGRHLLKYAQEHAAKTRDPDYVAAIRLFIAEEQRHARDLGRFLSLNGIPLVRATFTDSVFRRLRCLVGTLEISIAVLITAELIAKVYYAMLRKATGSEVLRTLCDQILRDELRHVQFQAEQLARLRAGRTGIPLWLTTSLQRFLFLGTVLTVYVFHRRVVRAGGGSATMWWVACWREYDEAFCRSIQSQPLRVGTA